MIELALYFVGFIVGLAIGFAAWGPDSAFKEGFMEAITLKIIWGRFVK